MVKFLNKSAIPVCLALTAAMAAGTLVLALSRGGSADHRTTHRIHTDYPVYRSVADLARGADLIVTATSLRAAKSRMVMPVGTDAEALPSFKREALGFPMTTTTYRVNVVHRGSAAQKIQVDEVGGVFGSDTFADSEQPRSLSGQRMLLFLVRNSDGNYSVRGGPQGRYLDQNGVGHPLASSSLPSPLAGKDVANPDLSDTTPVVAVEPGEGREDAPAGNGGKPAISGPPTNGD